MSIRTCASCLAVLLFSAAEAAAQNFTWNSITGVWSDGTNWTPEGPPPSATDTSLFFRGMADYVSTNDLTGDFSLLAIQITDEYDATGGVLTTITAGKHLAFAPSGRVSMFGTGTFTINHNILTNADLEIAVNSGNLWVGNSAAAGFAEGPGNIALTGGDLLLTGGGTDTTSLTIGSVAGGGVISDGGPTARTVQISGPNFFTVTLYGTNSYSGLTEFTGGSLLIGNDAALGTSTLHIDLAGCDCSTIGAVDGSRSIANVVEVMSDFTLGGIGATHALTLSGPVTLNGDGSPGDFRLITMIGQAATISGPIGEGRHPPASAWPSPGIAPSP